MQGADTLLGGGGVLPAGVIAIAPVTDANKAEPTGGVVRSLQFHPNGQLLLTAGLDKRLRLFQVRSQGHSQSRHTLYAAGSWLDILSNQLENIRVQGNT